MPRLTVSALLPGGLSDLSQSIRDQMSEDDLERCAAVAWDCVSPQLRAALDSALDCDLIAVIAKAWATAELLAEYGEPMLHPSDELSLVELGGHDVSRELSPVITVTIDPCPPVELKFTLALRARFSGVRLTICDGHIVAGDLGESVAQGQLSLNGVPLHDPAETRPVQLPARVEFDPPGIAIGRQRPDARAP